MKQGDVRLDAVLEQLIDQSLIVGEPRLIRLAAALGKNTRPGQGEAIGLRAQILEQFYVFLVEMVRIPGDIARFALMSFAGRVGENVPNGRAAAFYGNRALNLIGAGGATPEKIGRKGQRFRHRRLAECGRQRYAGHRAGSADRPGKLAAREAFQP